MVDNRDDRDSEGPPEPDIDQVGRRGGYAAAFDETVFPMERADVGASAVSGVWIGMVSGMAMGLVMMVLYAAVGLSFWLPMKIVAVSVLGPAALTGGAVPVITGVIVHLITAAVLGMVFGVLVSGLVGRVSLGTAVTAGVLYGLIVWIVAQFIVLPAVYPLIAVAMVPWIFGLSHVIYGIGLGLLPGAYRA